jgi:hypothetical protein
MTRRFDWPLILATAILAGCSGEEEEPYSESIPDIPPGRSAVSPEGNGASGYQPPAPPGANAN